MKLYDIIFGTCLISSAYCIDTGLSVSKRLDILDEKFKNEGASLSLLDEYENLLGLGYGDESINHKVHYKHGIINLILKRDLLASEDFSNCLDTNFYCLKKYIEIGLDYGTLRSDEIKSFLKNEKLDDDLKTNLLKYDEKTHELENLNDEKDWEKCIQICTDLESISRNNFNLYSKKIECLKMSDYNFTDLQQRLNIEYNKALNINYHSTNEKELLVDYLNLNLFTMGNEKTNKLLKKCLKTDNEFEACKNLNRINLKFSKMINLFNEINNYLSFIYSTENNDVELFEDIEDEKWNTIFNLLFKEKIRFKNAFDTKAFANYKINEDQFDSNFDLIIELYIEMVKHAGLRNYQDKEHIAENSEFLKNILKLGRQSYFETDQLNQFKKSKVFNSKYYKLIKNDNDIVTICRDFDKFFKKKNYNKAKEVLDKANKNMKLCKEIKERMKKIEEVMQHQQQQHRQQQQWQQQQHHHHQQQQHQRRKPSKPFKPKNDYYKILGVDKNADEADIKKAYRQKMRENHPDKVSKDGSKTNDEIEETVSHINNAYEILSDPEKRRNYDEFGEDPNDPENAQRRQQWDNQNRPNQGFGNGGHFGGAQFGGGGFDFGNVFRNFGGFGGQNPGSHGQKQQYQHKFRRQ